jgi:hypothetical protein
MLVKPSTAPRFLSWRGEVRVLRHMGEQIVVEWVAKEALAGSPEGAWASPRYAQPCLPDDAGDAGDEAAEEALHTSVFFRDDGRHINTWTTFHLPSSILKTMCFAEQVCLYHLRRSIVKDTACEGANFSTLGSTHLSSFIAVYVHVIVRALNMA